MNTRLQKLSEKLNDPRIAKLPSQANCWEGGPTIYTVLEDTMKIAGFKRTEYRIGHNEPQTGENIVLSGYVRPHDPLYHVFLKAN